MSEEEIKELEEYNLKCLEARIEEDEFYSIEEDLEETMKINKKLQQENQLLKEQKKLYETYLNRFFKINNKSYDGKIILKQLKQRDEVIDKAIKWIEEYTQDWTGDEVEEDMLQLLIILNKCKGDNNE